MALTSGTGPSWNGGRPSNAFCGLVTPCSGSFTRTGARPRKRADLRDQAVHLVDAAETVLGRVDFHPRIHAQKIGNATDVIVVAVRATASEVTELMMTNTFGPIRLAHRLLEHLIASGGTLAFMSSDRGSVSTNSEGGLELYRASKAALNILARGLCASHRKRGLTVLSIHPGWARTAMGTLGGTVEPEIELEPSVRGVADVLVRHMGSGETLYPD